MAVELDVRVSKLEQWRDTADEDIRELKTQLNETVKKSDLERLENKLDERDHNYMKNLWRLVFSLIVVFTRDPTRRSRVRRERLTWIVWGGEVNRYN